MVNVIKENFVEQSNDFLHHLPNAAFIAIDEEMTGISVVTPPSTSSSSPNDQANKQQRSNNNNNSKDATPAQRYSDVKLAPERYNIIQLGIALYFYHPPTTTTATTTATTTTASAASSSDHPYLQHHVGIAGDVTRLPSSPVRSSNNGTRSSHTTTTNTNSHTTRRGYATSGTEPHPTKKPAAMIGSTNDVNDIIPPGTTYTVRRYNFYMFPSSTNRRDITLNVATVAFLLEHNMSFDLWTKSGISFATNCTLARNYMKSYIEQERRLYKEEQQQQQQLLSSSKIAVQDTNQNRVVLRRPEDIEFLALTMATLREWLDNPGETTSATSTSTTTDYDYAYTNVNNDPYSVHSLLLPPCNSFLRRALYESIDKNYPSLIVEKDRQSSNSYQQQIRVFRLNADESIRRKHYLQKQRHHDFIMNQIGIYRIFAALRLVCNGYTINYDHILFAKSYNDIDWDSMFRNVDHPSPYEIEYDDDGDEMMKYIGLEIEQEYQAQPLPTRNPIPLVVHNGFMDLCFVMTHFVTNYKLPDQYQVCKEMIHTFFPCVYDTKLLATECPCWHDITDATAANDQHTPNTGLSNLFQIIARDPNYYHLHLIHDPEGNVNQNNITRTLLDDVHVVKPYVSSSISSTTTVDDQEHEAAYDAYMTGVIFIGLCHRIHQRIPNRQQQQQQINNDVNAITPMVNHNTHKNRNYTELRTYYGLNMIHQMSIYTMDLEETRCNRDPMSRGLIPKYAYRISNLDKSTTTRDIVTALSNLRDGQNRPINFIIIWIDDTTIFVATSYRPPPVVAVQGVEPDIVQQQPVIANDDPEEGEEIEDDALTEAAVVTHADVVHQPREDTDSILREHAAVLLHALQGKFHNNTETTIVVLEDYLALLALGINDTTGTHSSTSNIVDSQKIEQQPNSWIDRIRFLMGWPLTDTTNEKYTLDGIIDSSSPANKRQRIR